MMFKMSAFSVYDKGVSVRGVQWSTRTELSDLKVSSGSQDSPSQHVYSCVWRYGVGSWILEWERPLLFPAR